MTTTNDSLKLAELLKTPICKMDGGLMVTIGRRKVWCGLRQIHFHHKGKEDFTKSVLNTEVIRKQRCTFASSKRMAQTVMAAEAQQSGIGDFPTQL